MLSHWGGDSLQPIGWVSDARTARWGGDSRTASYMLQLLIVDFNAKKIPLESVTPGVKYEKIERNKRLNSRPSVTHLFE